MPYQTYEEEEDAGYYPLPIPIPQQRQPDFPTDWNVHLGISGQDQRPPPDPFEGWRVPENVSPEEANRLVSTMFQLRKEAERNRQAALRWQGEQDYARVLQQSKAQGLDDYEASLAALAAAAPKLFYGNPERLIGVSSALRQQLKSNQVEQPQPDLVEVGGQKFARTVDRFGNHHLIKIGEDKVNPKESAEYLDLSEEIRTTRSALESITEENNKWASKGGAEPEGLEAQAKLEKKLESLRKERAALFKRYGVEPPPEEKPEVDKSKAKIINGRVRVKSPTGATGTIPEAQLDEALRAGYTLTE